MDNWISANKKLNKLSIADLKAIRDYCLYQSEHRSWELSKWSNIAIPVIDVLEMKIEEIFKPDKLWMKKYLS